MDGKGMGGNTKKRPLGKAEDVAARTGMKPSWVRREGLNGNLPAVVVAQKGRKRSIRFDMDALETWIDQHRIDQPHKCCGSCR